MKKIISVIVLLGTSVNAFAKTSDATVAVKASVTGATCQIVPTPAEINFNTMTAADIGNNRIAAKEVALSFNCDWIAKQIKITFTPAAGTQTGNTNVMLSGKTGLGFKLQFANAAAGTLVDTPFGVEQRWANATTSAAPYASKGKFSLKPFHISGQEIAAGNVDTNLAISVQYD